MNSIHERALRITYQDHIYAFQELLSKDNSISISQKFASFSDRIV